MIKRLLAVVVLFWLLGQAHGQIPFDKIRGPVAGMTDPATKLQVAVSPVFTRVNAIVTDGIAQAVVTQTFVNPFNASTEVVYVFPLPDQGSVHGMQYRFHDSLYVAKIMERAQAEAKYDSIKQGGGQAALLIQDRPNVFQQRIANMGAGETAHVEIRLSMALKYADGEMELAFPTMIGPRYGSGIPTQAGSWNPPENREGPGFQFNILLESGVELSGITSPSHPVEVGTLDVMRKALLERQVMGDAAKTTATFNRGVVLKTQATYPNRDFVLRMKRASTAHDFSVASYRDTKGQGYFMLSLFPDPSLFAGKRPDMDFVFLVDVSGSQSGWPLEREKEICLNLFSRLTPSDDISVLSFSNDVTYAFGSETPVAATRDNLAKAETFVRALVPLGGTELLNAVKKSLAVPERPGKQRCYIFLTDGFITNEKDILEAIRLHPSRPTIFTFGAGNSLNRYFLEETAKVGDGFAVPLMQADAVGPAVDAAWGRIQSPQMENIQADFGTLSVSDEIYPVSRKLYRGLPFTVYGKYSQGGTYTFTLTADQAGKAVTLTRQVTLAADETLSWSVPKLWARERIGRLVLAQGTGTTHRASILQVSLEHQVLCEYTAFLAAQPQSTTPGGGNPTTVLEQGRTKLNPAFSAFRLESRGGLLFLEWTAPETVLAIRVMDLRGRVLFIHRPAKGLKLSRWVWDGRNARGQSLGHGSYLVSVETAQGIRSQRLEWNPAP